MSRRIKCQVQRETQPRKHAKLNQKLKLTFQEYGKSRALGNSSCQVGLDSFSSSVTLHVTPTRPKSPSIPHDTCLLTTSSLGLSLIGGMLRLQPGTYSQRWCPLSQNLHSSLTPRILDFLFSVSCIVVLASCFVESDFVFSLTSDMLSIRKRQE